MLLRSIVPTLTHAGRIAASTQGAKPVFAAYARIVGSEKSNPSA
jgi:hypothetical protein